MRPLLAALLVVATGCGYRFTTGGALPEGVQRLCAPIFFNRTAEPGLEVIFTEAMRNRLLRTASLAGPCDARIEGEVQSVYAAPQALTTRGVLSTYRVYATALLKLTRDGRVLSETSVTGWEDYLPTNGDPALNVEVLDAESNRQAALRRLADQLMHDGYARLASGW